MSKQIKLNLISNITKKLESSYSHKFVNNNLYSEIKLYINQQREFNTNRKKIDCKKIFKYVDINIKRKKIKNIY